jgi:type IV fimbrial biogenesis protein FimT
VLNAFQKSAGFTLIEMMIVVSIIFLLTTLGIPSFRAWVQNTQIYTSAEATMNGLQKAQAEAVKQNTNIEFVLGANPPWRIQLPGNTATCPNLGATLLECSTSEGSIDVTNTGKTIDSTTGTTAAATKITFNSLGGVGVPPNTPLNSDGSAPLRQIDFNSSKLANSSRVLRVTIGNKGVGSNIRMCDPALTGTASPRAC